jgi:Leucine-rich repeat (LRR) protein
LALANCTIEHDLDQLTPFFDWLAINQFLTGLDLSYNFFDPSSVNKVLSTHPRLCELKFGVEFTKIGEPNEMIKGMIHQTALEKLTLQIKCDLDNIIAHDLEIAKRELSDIYLEKYPPRLVRGIDLNKEKRNREMNEELAPSARKGSLIQTYRRACRRLFLSLPESLTSLTIRGSNMGTLGAEGVGQWISRTTSIRSLNLSKNSFTAPSIDAICVELIANKKIALEELDLSNNSICDSQTFCTWLTQVTTLKKLNVGFDHYQLQSTKRPKTKENQIGHLLAQNPQLYLTELDLRWHRWIPGETEEFVNWVKNRSLVKLNLQDNRGLEMEGVMTLMKLKESGSLIELNLSKPPQYF